MDINALANISKEWDIENQGVEYEEPPESRWLFDLCRDKLEMNEDNYEVGLKPLTHNEFCYVLEEAVGDCLFRGNKQTLVHLEMPRFTFKTSIACEGLVIGAIVRNPNITTLIVCADHRNAKKRIIGAKYHLTKNEDFLAEYEGPWKPDFQEASWSSNVITVAKRTKGALREATIETTSVGIDSTGAHFDLIICDDIVNDKNTITVENRDLVFSFMKKLLMQLNPGGALIILGTRWHVDDAYGRIIKEDEARSRDGLEPRFKYFIRSCWDGPNGLFFPEKLDHQFLENQRFDQGPRVFAANYENKPVADEDRVFDMDTINIMPFELYKVNNSNIIRLSTGEQYPVSVTMAWDPAGINPNRKSDYHGITIVGTDFADRWWVLLAAQWKTRTATEILDRICSQIAYYTPDKIIIESVGGYVLWIPQLQRALREKGLSVVIDEDNTGGQNKSTRIQMLEPRCSSGRMYLLPHQKALIEQLTNFSSANELVHEDILDSLAKHEGRTKTAGQRIPEKIDVFEVDEDYMNHLSEIAKDAKAGKAASAGSFGMKWKV
jgi:phage terminase large subunit-like protein